MQYLSFGYVLREVSYIILKINDPLANETIDIIGAGFLGRTLAETFIEHGFPREKLMISYGGKPSTFESIKKAGLIRNITDNRITCQKSTIIFIAIKPQSLKELKELPFTKNSLVVSCMAGISLASLEGALGISNVFRIIDEWAGCNKKEERHCSGLPSK